MFDVRVIMLDISDMSNPDNPLQTKAEILVFCSRIQDYLNELKRISETFELTGDLVA